MKYVDNFSVRVNIKRENELIEALRDRGLRCYRREEHRGIYVMIVEFWYEATRDDITPEDIAEWTKHVNCIKHFHKMRGT